MKSRRLFICIVDGVIVISANNSWLEYVNARNQQEHPHKHYKFDVVVDISLEQIATIYIQSSVSSCPFDKEQIKRIVVEFLNQSNPQLKLVGWYSETAEAINNLFLRHYVT
ncbi:hypothetical protein NG797_04250 [Laspinema sp. D5]|nr:hypothetical protein [Laspinema sp. D3d]